MRRQRKYQQTATVIQIKVQISKVKKIRSNNIRWRLAALESQPVPARGRRLFWSDLSDQVKFTLLMTDELWVSHQIMRSLITCHGRPPAASLAVTGVDGMKLFSQDMYILSWNMRCCKKRLARESSSFDTVKGSITQFPRLINRTSKKLRGVPQGSLLGPFLDLLQTLATPTTRLGYAKPPFAHGMRNAAP